MPKLKGHKHKGDKVTCRKAGPLAVFKYVTSSSFRFLEQISQLKKIYIQLSVLSQPPLLNATFKLLDKKTDPEKSGI